MDVAQIAGNRGTALRGGEYRAEARCHDRPVTGTLCVPFANGAQSVDLPVKWLRHAERAATFVAYASDSSDAFFRDRLRAGLAASDFAVRVVRRARVVFGAGSFAVFAVDFRRVPRFGLGASAGAVAAVAAGASAFFWQPAHARAAVATPIHRNGAFMRARL